MCDSCPPQSLRAWEWRKKKHKLIIIPCELGYKGEVESGACVCHTQWVIFPVSGESMVMGAIVP